MSKREQLRNKRAEKLCRELRWQITHYGGSPKHPLYCKSNIQPVKFNP